MSDYIILNFSLLPKSNFASYICGEKNHSLCGRTQLGKPSQCSFPFTFSAYPEAWTDTVNSRTLSILHVQFTSSSTHCALSKARAEWRQPGPHRGETACAHGSRGVRRWQKNKTLTVATSSQVICTSIFFFFLEKLVNTFETHTGIFFSQFKPWRGSFVDYRTSECNFKNLYPLFVVWCLMMVSLLAFP